VKPWGVSVIVPSYNRPRLLREALASIDYADQVVLADDASDFDALALFREYDHFPARAFVTQPGCTLDERLSVPRQGNLLNKALEFCQHEVVCYLCDDDLFAPGWTLAALEYLREHPDQHLAAGEWRLFDDGQDPATESREAPRAYDGMETTGFAFDYRELTTGMLAHRLTCFTDEGVGWDPRSVAVHDDFFFRNLHAVHPLPESVARLPVLAGYRREHAHNMLPYTDWPSRYTPGARAVLAGGMLE
jgi:glycosyltransferase involved in cell wall biosynthesis